MRKTRSQTQAENALLADNNVNISTRSVSSAATAATSKPTTLTNNLEKNLHVSAGAQKRHAPSVPNGNNYLYHNTTMRDYEQMLQLLRVVELQQILSFVNIPFAGRKADLQKRILALLRTHFELIAPKIEEISRQSVAEQQASVAHFAQPTDPKRMYSHLQMAHNVQTNGGTFMTPAGPVSIPGAAHHQSAQQQQQQQQHLQQRTHPYNATAEAAAAVAAAAAAATPAAFLPLTAQLPTHPDVRLKKLSFYDILSTLIKPSSLLARTTQRVQEASYVFTLSPQQATEIATNRDFRNSSKVEHVVQVQLRLCLLETSCEQDDCFPNSLTVKVNNKICQLPNIIPTNRQHVEAKRPPRPLNVTTHVKLSPTAANQILIQWSPDYPRNYCLAVYLVKKLTSAQLLHRMKTKGVKPADCTRGLIKEKLEEDADCEIATTMLKVSLNCPLGKMKMSIPCRATTCSHLQCFDANLYLQMNERKPTWHCPVCDKPALYDNLVIDGYFQEVLASPLLNPDDTEIQLHKDGSWSTHSLRNETQVIDTPTKPVQKVEVISDDVELITEDVKPVKVAATTAVPNDQPTSTTSNSETVDLTLSDSDDDLPLAKRRSHRQATNGATASPSPANLVSSSSTNGVIGGSGSSTTAAAGGGGGGGSSSSSQRCIPYNPSRIGTLNE